MNILCSVAFLYQKQRPIVYLKVMKLINHIAALPVDFYMAWLVAEQGLQGRVLRTLSLFQPGESLTVKDVALKLDYSQNRAREILNVLADKGFLDKDEEEKEEIRSFLVKAHKIRDLIVHGAEYKIEEGHELFKVVPRTEEYLRRSIKKLLS